MTTLPSQYIYHAAKKLLDRHGEEAALMAIEQACQISENQSDEVAYEVLLQVRQMLQSIAKMRPDGDEAVH